MGRVTIFLHRSVQDHLDFLADKILGLSRSETVETMIRYIFDEGLKSEVFEHENYDEKIEEFEERVEEYKEAMAPVWEKEEESESESEDSEEEEEEEEED